MERIQLENHHFPVPSLMTDTGKDHQWVENHSVGERLRTGYLHSLKILSHGLFIEY